MLEFLEQLGSHIQDFIVMMGYPGVALMMLLECVFPPIPSELVLPYTGYLVNRGDLAFWGVWLAGQMGSVGGAIILYYVGKWSSDQLVIGFLAKYGRWIGVSEADYARALRVFDRHGEWIILIGRLVPVIRSLISLPAGADHMPLKKFLLYTALGTGIWNGILIFAGVKLGENWEDVMTVIAQYQNAVAVALVIGMVVFIGMRSFAYFRKETSPASEI